MGKSKRHEWRERSADGEIKIYRGWCHGTVWTLQYTYKTDEEWTVLDPISREDLLKLREKVWDKYQRNRVPHKHIEQLDEMIEDAPLLADLEIAEDSEDEANEAAPEELEEDNDVTGPE